MTVVVDPEGRGNTVTDPKGIQNIKDKAAIAYISVGNFGADTVAEIYQGDDLVAKMVYAVQLNDMVDEFVKMLPVYGPHVIFMSTVGVGAAVYDMLRKKTETPIIDVG